MEAKEITDLIIKIRKNQEIKGIYEHIDEFIYKNLQKLRKHPKCLILLLIEIDKKTDAGLDYLIWYFLKHLDIFLEENVLEIFIFYGYKLTCDLISRCYINSLSLDLIEKYADKLDWEYISGKRNLPEEFLEKHANRLNWQIVSKCQKLSENFIEKHADKVNWEHIFKCQNIYKKFREKHEWRIK